LFVAGACLDQSSGRRLCLAGTESFISEFNSEGEKAMMSSIVKSSLKYQLLVITIAIALMA
jgi:hypothetical protein